MPDQFSGDGLVVEYLQHVVEDAAAAAVEVAEGVGGEVLGHRLGNTHPPPPAVHCHHLHKFSFSPHTSRIFIH